MARVDLSDSLYGNVWVCQTTTFSESANEREWGTFLTHEGFSTHAEAREWASRLANDYMDVLLRLIGAEGYDGISVDVQPRVYHGDDYEPKAMWDSWEVIPGRPVSEWHCAGDPFRTYEGSAYAVLEGDGTLTLFRSDEKYAEGTTCLTRDVLGTERRGITWECPEGPVSRNDPLPGWLSHKQEIRNVRVADGQAIWPVSCAGWFAKCESLETLDLSGLDTSKVTDMSLMFFGCHSLERLDLADLDTSHVTDMSYMFRGCESLTSLDLSGWDTSRVKDTSHMFAGCESLESLDVFGWDLSSARHLKCMFYGCESLESLDVFGWDTFGVSDMSLMFACCESLEKVDVASWDVSKVMDMSHMFADCHSLRSLDLSGWDTPRLDPEGTDSMFFGCTSLDSPILPEGSALEEEWSLEQSMAEHDER